MIGRATLAVAMGGLAVVEALGGERLSPRGGQHRVFATLGAPVTRGSGPLRLRGGVDLVQDGGGAGAESVDSTLSTNGPSGVWDGFKRIGGKGEGVGSLKGTLADVLGKPGSARRSQPETRFAVHCEGLPEGAVVSSILPRLTPGPPLFSGNPRILCRAFLRTCLGMIPSGAARKRPLEATGRVSAVMAVRLSGCSRECEGESEAVL